MKKIFFAAMMLSSLTSSAQKIYFPASNYTDSVKLDKGIHDLAIKLTGDYKNDDRAAYLRDRIVISIAAGEYTDVQPVVAELSKIQFNDPAVTGAQAFPSRIYAAVMMMKPATEADFNREFNQLFSKYYDGFDDDNKNWVGEYFGKGILERTEGNYQRLLTELKESDSLTIRKAADLANAYTVHRIYQRTLSLALNILRTKEDERYIVADSVDIKLPGGAIVTATIVRSRKDPSPHPVSLSYNIYAGSEIFAAKDAVFRGYVGVVVNPRGKRTSPDPIIPFEFDGDDGYYIIDWISKQSWCNGKIGMYGGSYLGFAQWATMKKVHPALKTVVPQVSVGAGIDYPYFNGVFMTYALRWIHYVTNNKTVDQTVFSDDEKWKDVYTNWYKSGKSIRALDTVEGHPKEIFQQWLSHPTFDSYWQNTIPNAKQYAAISIPILTTTGYWDDDQLGAQWYYRQYHKYNKNPNYYLVIGPYDHGGSQYYPRANLLGYTIDSVARQSMINLVYQWFDYVMKDSIKPSILKDKVNFEVAGANEWRHVSSLAGMSNDTIRFYMGQQSSEDRMALTTKKPLPNQIVFQTTDLRDRSTPHRNSFDVMPFPDLVSDTMYQTKGKIIMRSEPFDKETVISGNITAALKFITNKKDADIVMQVYEEMPDGKYLSLCEILQRASLAKDRTKRQLLRPGHVEEIPLNVSHLISRKFSKGSRLVMVLGVNNNDAWEVNYGSGKNVSDETVADAGEPMVIRWVKESCFMIPVLR